MKYSIPETSRPSLIKHADGNFYTRYFSPVYDALTRLSGWRQKIARHALEGINPCRLLDVGCGTGYLMNLARSKGFDVTGLDASEGMLKQAEDQHRFGASRLIFATADQLPFEDESFDLVIACGSLVHIPAVDACAKEMIRVARKGGLIRVVDHAVPAKKYWNTALFEVFSQLSGDILHAYDRHFEGPCRRVSHKTLGRGGFMQRFDYRK